MANEFEPYVGPRPFEREDQQRFFGRERESSELLSRVIAHSAVLLYSQSGAGKTSLLNARLIPLLEKEGFQILPIARVRGLVPKGIQPEEISNIYVLNVLMSWAGGVADPKTLAAMTIADFLQSGDRPIGREEMPAPRVAIFDQFEELFTFYPERWNDRQDLFDQIGEVLEADHRMRIIFVMREDYIAELDPYISALPEKLRTRFRLERLREHSALEAVTEPLDGTGYSFAAGVGEKLINNLLKVPVETSVGVTTVVGEFIEPVQLQVVCQTMWRKLNNSDNKVITLDQLKAFGDVDRALSDFYETTITDVTKVTGVNEGVLRRWFEHTLITPSGTRGTVFRGREETGGIPNAVVNRLVDHHLIRGEVRGGARWYELTHDRLIEPIIASNNQWMLQRSGAEQTRQRLEKRATEWVRQSRPTSELLDEAELLEAKRWLESPNATDVGYSEKLFALVQASRAAVEEAQREREKMLAVEQQRRADAEHARVKDQERHIQAQNIASRRLRRFAAALAVMFLLAIVTAAYAVNRSRVATSETKRAQQKEHEANAALAAVKREKERANEQMEIANRETQIANEQRLLAEERKTEAEKAKQTATAALKLAKENAKAEARLMAREAERDKASEIVSSANVLYQSKLYAEAIVKYGDARDIYESINDKNAEADMLINTAISYLMLGREAKGDDRKENYGLANRYFDKALALKTETSGAESDEVARILNYTGVVYADQEKYEQAKAYYEQALAIRKTIGAQDSELALSYSNLGAAYSELGQYPQAQEAYEHALAIRRKTLSDTDPQLVTSYSRVASAESLRGHYLKAEEILKNSLKILNTASASKDTDLDRASILNQLGLTYAYRGRFPEAIASYQEALNLNRQARGPGSAHEATNLHNLAVATIGMAKYSEAEAYEKSALDIYLKNPGRDQEGEALAFVTMARVRREQAKYDEAESLFNQALTKMREIKGHEHSRIGTILNYLAQFYVARREFAKAEIAENEALAIYRKQLEPGHWYIARGLGTLAMIYAGQKRSVEAEKAYRESIQGLEATFGSDHPELAAVINGLAKLYIEQARYPEAEPLVKRSLAIREKMLSLDHPSVADSLETYAGLLLKTNRNTEAAPMEARAKGIRAKYLYASGDN